VATAVLALGSAAGYRMWATSRDEAKRERALELGADAAFASGERLPERVDAVMETVGEATWKHSLRSLRSGGTMVIAGATTGDSPPADLAQIFFLQRSVVGSTMGTVHELARLVRFMVARGVRPVIDSVMPLGEARAALEKLRAGDVSGKIVLTP
jgi:D-arabinose 1-dehydrogenase-like Zn-dependent alcohol dehydrogenase